MSYSFPVKRTPEQGHTAPCMAKALISAIENARDLAVNEAHGKDGTAQYDFRSMVQDNVPLTWADSYLAEGIAECICPEPDLITATVGERPECDVHKHEWNEPGVPAVVDGATRIIGGGRGSWAYMCQSCFDAFGVGLGLGKGQRLIVRDEL